MLSSAFIRLVGSLAWLGLVTAEAELEPRQCTYYGPIPTVTITHVNTVVATRYLTVSAISLSLKTTTAVQTTVSVSTYKTTKTVSKCSPKPGYTPRAVAAERDLSDRADDHLEERDLVDRTNDECVISTIVTWVTASVTATLRTSVPAPTTTTTTAIVTHLYTVTTPSIVTSDRTLTSTLLATKIFTSYETIVSKFTTTNVQVLPTIVRTTERTTSKATATQTVRTTVVSVRVLPGSVVTRTVVSTLPVHTITYTQSGQTFTTTLPASRTTLIQTSTLPGQTVTVTKSKSVCAAPTNSPGIDVVYDPKSNLTWGCVPGKVCSPRRLGGCSVKAPPANNYVCDPLDCIPAPKFTPVFWKDRIPTYYPPNPDYFQLDPTVFGLTYDIFEEESNRSPQPANSPATPLRKRVVRKAKGPKGIFHKLFQRIEEPSIPGCYPYCQNAYNEALRVGKDPKLCVPAAQNVTGTFLAAYRDCESCIREAGDIKVEDQEYLDTKFGDFLNYCKDPQPAASGSSSPPIPNVTAEPTASTGTQAPPASTSGPSVISSSTTAPTSTQTSGSTSNSSQSTTSTSRTTTTPTTTTTTTSTGPPTTTSPRVTGDSSRQHTARTLFALLVAALVAVVIS